jgi:hypothetical protein
MKLQTARQGKNESPQEFADRCRGLSQKVMCKVSFVAGLIGIAGKQVRYANPRNLEQALSIALAVQEAEKKRTVQ